MCNNSDENLIQLTIFHNYISTCNIGSMHVDYLISIAKSVLLDARFIIDSFRIRLMSDS